MDQNEEQIGNLVDKSKWLEEHGLRLNLKNARIGFDKLLTSEEKKILSDYLRDVEPYLSPMSDESRKEANKQVVDKVRNQSPSFQGVFFIDYSIESTRSELSPKEASDEALLNNRARERFRDLGRILLGEERKE